MPARLGKRCCSTRWLGDVVTFQGGWSCGCMSPLAFMQDQKPGVAVGGVLWLCALSMTWRDVLQVLPPESGAQIFVREDREQSMRA